MINNVKKKETCKICNFLFLRMFLINDVLNNKKKSWRIIIMSQNNFAIIIKMLQLYL